MNQKHKLQHISNKKNTFKQHTRIKNAINSTKSIPKGGTQKSTNDTIKDAAHKEEEIQNKKQFISDKDLLDNFIPTEERAILKAEIKEKMRETGKHKKHEKQIRTDVLKKRGYDYDESKDKFVLKDKKAVKKTTELNKKEDKFSKASREELIGMIGDLDPRKFSIINKDIDREKDKIQKKYKVESNYSETFADGVRDNLSYASNSFKNLREKNKYKTKDKDQATDNVLQRRGYKKVGDDKYLLVNYKPYNIYDLTITLQEKHNSWEKMKWIDETIKTMASLFKFELFNLKNDTEYDVPDSDPDPDPAPASASAASSASASASAASATAAGTAAGVAGTAGAAGAAAPDIITLNYEIKKYLNILNKLMSQAPALDDNLHLNIGYDVASEILRRYCFQPHTTKSTKDPKQKVILKDFNDKPTEFEIDTSQIDANENIIISCAIPQSEETDSDESNEHENLNKLLSVFENETEFKKFQRRIANASTMEELQEIKTNLGSGFDIDDTLSTISYKYDRNAFQPDEAAEAKAIHDLITKLNEKIKNPNTKSYFSEISKSLNDAIRSYENDKSGDVNSRP